MPLRDHFRPPIANQSSWEGFHAMWHAVTCRGRRVAEQPRFEVWAYPLVMGQNLPVLPIWIADDMAVPLDLETTYEATCQSLRLA